MQAVLSLLTLLLPTLLKIIGAIIDKKRDSDELKREFLVFLSKIEKDIPVKLRQDYQDQITHIKAQLKIEDDRRVVIAEEHANYKESYEKLLAEHKELLCQIQK